MRVRLLVAIGLLAAFWPLAAAEAQVQRVPWTKSPSVSIVSEQGDRRIAAVHEAVDYWNRALGELGTPFRLGPVSHTVGAIPRDQLQQLSAGIADRSRPLPIPEAVREAPGDLVIVLSEGEFVSFAALWPPQQKGLVAIRSDWNYPLSLPNVTRNLIAHELGHALGLRHNDDPAMLMCGRPAPCRPEVYRSDTERFFPLTEAERAQLRAMYGASGKPSASVPARTAAKLPTIGWLETGPSSRKSNDASAFMQGLRDLGWQEGKNIAVERRYAEGRTDRLPALAVELVRLDVKVLVAADSSAIAPAMAATTAIPIVMTVSGDPVGQGLVASLARPGGNVTGLTNITPELAARRLQLLGETLPRLSRLAVIGWVDHPDWKPLVAAAAARGVRLQTLMVSQASELSPAFEAARREHADAVIVLPGPLTNRFAMQLADAAASAQLPTMYGLKHGAVAGGLMAYGPSIPELHRRAASYVDKLLKGAKPADLPVEQPMKFELVVNLKTAAALGIRVPDTLLLQADEVLR